MEHVQQTEVGQCQTCCVAMLTGMTREQVEAKVKLRHNLDDNVTYLPDREAARFLVELGFTFGLHIQGIADWSGDWFVPNVKQWNAILSVRSKKNPDWQHAVVWDASLQMVRDPWHSEPKPLAEYDVIEWIPVQRMGCV